ADEFYARAATQQPEGLPRPAPGSDTLVLVESGTSPVKLAAGAHGEGLKFSAGDNPFVSASIGAVQMPVFADVGWQAGTLGGRQVDVILNGKANFREGADTVGDLGMLGAQFALGSDSIEAAAAMALVGVAAKLMGKAVKTKADIRYWDNLPDRIYGSFVAGAGTTLPDIIE